MKNKTKAIVLIARQRGRPVGGVGSLPAGDRPDAQGPRGLRTQTALGPAGHRDPPLSGRLQRRDALGLSRHARHGQTDDRGVPPLPQAEIQDRRRAPQGVE